MFEWYCTQILEPYSNWRTQTSETQFECTVHTLTKSDERHTVTINGYFNILQTTILISDGPFILRSKTRIY